MVALNLQSPPRRRGTHEVTLSPESEPSKERKAAIRQECIAVLEGLQVQVAPRWRLYRRPDTGAKVVHLVGSLSLVEGGVRSDVLEAELKKVHPLFRVQPRASGASGALGATRAARNHYYFFEVLHNGMDGVLMGGFGMFVHVCSQRR